MKDIRVVTSPSSADPKTAIQHLLNVMAALRDPKTGCPWDVEQTFETISPYTIEEAYEVADAIARADMADLKEELGDLLLQVVYHSQIASERAGMDNAFTFGDVADAIADKMIRRHPHVFGDASVDSAAAQSLAWEEVKAEERRLKGKAVRDSLLDDIPLALPALTRAEKLQKRAARGGFDWPETSGVVDKIDEELLELKAEIAADAGADRLSDELGDLLFTVVNLARHLKIDPEEALRRTNRKFERRFRSVEQALGDERRSMADTPLDRLEALWQSAKSEDPR
ncbi:MAG: nucleoside triphosphate pyrophosphohydrolase [Geminicoccaceae bacterium]